MEIAGKRLIDRFGLLRLVTGKRGIWEKGLWFIKYGFKVMDRKGIGEDTRS